MTGAGAIRSVPLVSCRYNDGDVCFKRFSIAATIRNMTKPSFKEPVIVYTAQGNLEAHSIVNWLTSQGIPCYAVEDVSGASVFSIGPSQFHKPQVYVDKVNKERAVDLLSKFENREKEAVSESDNSPPIDAECEDCGTVSTFPGSQNGTVQSCPECHAYIDVGELDWGDVDFGEPEEED